MTAARTAGGSPASAKGEARGEGIRVCGRRADPADEGGRRSRRRIDRGTVGGDGAASVSEEGEDDGGTVHPRHRDCRARGAGGGAPPPGFQGRRASTRGAAASAALTGATYRSGRWGLRSRHGSLAGRTVGVELVASPCQRLRGCRHLQPSTGPVRPTSDTAARRNASAHARSTLARGISYFERRGAAAAGAIDRARRAKGHTSAPASPISAHPWPVPRLNAKGYRDRTRGATIRFARIKSFSDHRRVRIYYGRWKRVCFGYKKINIFFYLRCYILHIRDISVAIYFVTIIMSFKE